MVSRTTLTPSLSAPDVQASLPATQVSLSRVGVTGVEKVIRVKADGSENLFHANFECFVDLEPRQAGVHMSRFEEIVGEAIDEVVLGEAFKAEVLAAHIALRVRERGALPGDGKHPGERPIDPGDLRPLRHRGRLRAGHADADRRAGPGHDCLPLRPGDGR
jgi:Type I GTP cyclohydrolase folE2